jgi:hypothetical protein
MPSSLYSISRLQEEIVRRLKTFAKLDNTGLGAPQKRL